MKSIEDYLICPNCGHDMYEYSTDEIHFDMQNTGHYYVDVWCPHCKTNKRVYIDFTYEIFSFEMSD